VAEPDGLPAVESHSKRRRHRYRHGRAIPQPARTDDHRGFTVQVRKAVVGSDWVESKATHVNGDDVLITMLYTGLH